MKNISEILSEMGLEIPEDKKADFDKAVSENYKTVAEFNKRISKAEEERDGFKSRAETAETTLKGFEGVDLEKINKDLADWKQKAEDTEKEYNRKIAERDFNDALTEGIGKYKFTSEAAKRAVMAEIKKKGLTMSEGKILGLNDAIEQIKANDKGAFVDEEEEELEGARAKFTAPMDRVNSTAFSKMSLAEKMAYANAHPNAAVVRDWLDKK